jgi:peptidoglycan/LPS O-acetylase OafA/YrhL
MLTRPVSAPLDSVSARPAFPQNARDGRLRADIQALRGLAVLLVLLYHVGLAAPAAGFLGVDIFFVVSGFLITRLVRNDVLAGTFSFREFYFRRAKRLLPAAYTVLALCLLAAPWVLGTRELVSFAAQVAGALTFTTNVVLWNQTGYFAGAAELKPLLHFWSLAIEEQYYLLLPAALAFSPRRYWGFGLGAILVASLYAYALAVLTAPDDAFYWLPFRLWELGIGSAGALAATDPGRPVRRVLFWPALALLGLVPFLGATDAAPRAVATLIVCLATIAVVLREHPDANRFKPVRALARVGDMSYSLYLVHWPLFAFLRNAYLTNEVPLHARCTTLALSVALAWLLWRCVEEPFRRKKTRRPARFIVLLAILTCVQLGAAAFLAATAPSRENYALRLAPNQGLSVECEGKNRHNDRPECRTAAAPQMLLWGDSHAMHLAQAIQASTNRAFEQSTMSACAPVPGITRHDERHTLAWARTCTEFNDAVAAALASMTTVKVVVLAGSARPYVDAVAGTATLRNFRKDAGDGFVEAPASTDATLTALKGLVRTIRAAGKRVVWVASPPPGNFDIGRCLERRETGLLALGANPRCAMELENYRRVHASTLAFYARLETELEVPVVRFDSALCNSECITHDGDTFFYRDSTHLSKEGSRALGERLRLGELLWDIAR